MDGFGAGWKRPGTLFSIDMLQLALPKHSTDALSLIYSRAY